MGNENEGTKEKDLHLRAGAARREADDEPSLELVHLSGSGPASSLVGHILYVGCIYFIS